MHNWFFFSRSGTIAISQGKSVFFSKLIENDFIILEGPLSLMDYRERNIGLILGTNLQNDVQVFFFPKDNSHSTQDGCGEV